MELLVKFVDPKVIAITVVLVASVYFVMHQLVAWDDGEARARRRRAFRKRTWFGRLLFRALPLILGAAFAMLARYLPLEEPGAGPSAAGLSGFELLPAGIWPFVGLVAGGLSLAVHRWREDRFGARPRLRRADPPGSDTP